MDSLESAKHYMDRLAYVPDERFKTEIAKVYALIAIAERLEEACDHLQTISSYLGMDTSRGG
jgi:hypothetical protein